MLDRQSTVMRNGLRIMQATGAFTVVGIALIGRFTHGDFIYFGIGAIFILIMASVVFMRTYLRGHGVMPQDFREYLAQSPFFISTQILLVVFLLWKSLSSALK